MTWRGRDEALECKTIEEFRNYLRGLNFTTGWRPSGMVLHNTASPNIQQWYYGSTSPEQRMENLKSYYENDQGWSAGPHAFISPGWEGPPGQPASVWIMTDFNVSGVHSPSWNGSRLGIEMVGDYDTESDETGHGAKVMELAVALFGECHAFFGWEPSNNSIKLHKEDPSTTHDCPGSNVIKSEFLADVSEYMGDGGDHLPPDSPQPTEVDGVVYNLATGDTLNIRASASSSAPIIGTADNGDNVLVIGEAYNGSTRYFRLQFGNDDLLVYGWASAAYIKRTGETPPAEIWHSDITATEWDDISTAYPPFGPVNPEGLQVALPYKWPGERPVVVVEGPGGSVDCEIVDLGPWNLSDSGYCLGSLRPMSEKQFQNGTVAQNGSVPTNDAGIDLTREVARRVGIDGKGKVRWKFKT